MSLKHYLFFLILGVSVTSAAGAQHFVSAPEPETGTIIGTVTDVNDGIVPGATVALEGPSMSDPQRVETNDNGFFQLDHLNPEIPYRITVSASGFADWNSTEVILQPGEHMDLTDIRLRIAEVVTSVNAVFSTEELAREQEKAEEKQRVLGFIPNFYAVYDRDAVPLTPKLKFRLALKTTTDPITILGSAFLAGLDQAGNNHHFGQGSEASAGVIRAGGMLVTITGPTEARPADSLTIDFVVVPDRAQLSEVVQRARNGRLRTNIGNVAALDDAVAAFNPTERIKGKTIIRVRS